MENGATHPGPPQASSTRPVARDAREAVLLAERTLAQAVDPGVDPRTDARARAPSAGGDDDAAALDGAYNAFGERVRVEPRVDGVARVRRAASLAEAGERVALLASAAELAAARDVLREIAAHRLGVVFHAFEAQGAEAALSLADLGWGMLFASGIGESVDLTLVARRAAEDSGTPFLVVHEDPAGRRFEPLAPVDPGLVAAFVGPAAARTRRLSDPAHPVHAQVGARAFAERVPFALASALRELEALTGRRRDAVTRSAAGAAGERGEASLMLVGLGALGDVLLGEVPRLRAAGHDVGAVKLTAFRPFPGPRLVRLLSRALAITVLEHTDEPLAQSNPLTRELKAAFSDAITWAPEYPGVGRVPRVCSGVARAASSDVEAHDLAAIARNMAAGEAGKRFFVLGGDASLALEGDVGASPHPAAAPRVFHLRGVVRDTVLASASAALASSVLTSLLGLRVRASVRTLPAQAGGGHAFDVAASTEPPLGAHLASSLSLVLLDDAGALIQGNPVARLAQAGTLAVPSKRTSPEGLWADIPPYVKAIIHDRQGEVAGWDPPEAGLLDGGPWPVAAAFTGVALGAIARGPERRPHVDPSLVERDVAEAVALLSTVSPGAAQAAGAAARRAYETAVFVPRGVVEQDQEAIRLGRMDARAASPA